MNPYLEEPAGWPNFHVNLIVELQAQLNRGLRPKYYARAEERVYISDQDDPGRRVIIPDVRIIERNGWGDVPWTPDGDTSAVAVAEPIVATTVIEDEIREMRIEVIDAALREVVTVIEVLSPTNKIPGASGLESYRKKRAEVLSSQTHWVEIDLLRDGQRLIAGEVLPLGDYFVHVSRVSQRPSGLIWPVRLPQRLPVVPIPLRDPDPDTHVDLQQLLDAVYDRSSYDLSIDYHREPVPLLPANYAAWADRLLREKGLR